MEWIVPPIAGILNIVQDYSADSCPNTYLVCNCPTGLMACTNGGTLNDDKDKDRR